MWTLSGFADEISPDLDEQCERARRARHPLHRVPQRLGHATSSTSTTHELDRARKTLAGTASRTSSIGSPIGKINIEDDFDAHLRPVRPGAARRGAASGAVHPALLVLPARWRRPGAAPGRGAPPDDGAGRAGRGPRRGPAAREREGDLRRHPGARAWTSSSRSARPRCGWPGTRPTSCSAASRPFTDGYATLRPYIDYIQIKDAVAGRPARSCRPARATASSARRSRRCAPTASTASSPSSRISVFAGSLGGFSGADHFRRAHRAFTGLLDRAKESPTDDALRRIRFAVVGCGVIGNIHADRRSPAGAGRLVVLAVDESADRARELADDARWPPRPRRGGAGGPTTSTPSPSARPAARTPTCVVAALDAGKHVVVEKPLDVIDGRGRSGSSRPRRAAAGPWR